MPAQMRPPKPPDPIRRLRAWRISGTRCTPSGVGGAASHNSHGRYGHGRSCGVRGVGVRNRPTQVRRAHSVRGRGGVMAFSLPQRRSWSQMSCRCPSSLQAHVYACSIAKGQLKSGGQGGSFGMKRMRSKPAGRVGCSRQVCLVRH